LQASTWLGAFGFGLFMLGRLCGSAVISQLKPHRVLATYAAINVALSAVMMGGGVVGRGGAAAVFFGAAQPASSAPASARVIPTCNFMRSLNHGSPAGQFTIR